MWKKEPLYRLIILISWAIFLLVLLISGKFKLYVNSIYSPLIISGVIILFALIINGFKTFKEKSKHSHQLTATKFIGLFIILFPILLAILIKPGNLPLSAAITRGISTSISTTDTNFLDILKSQVESDESYKKLNLKQLLTIVSRQPDKIDGLQVAVEGFAHQNQEEPSNSLTIVRFLITCCAADATPLGVEVRSEEKYFFQTDAWVKAQGTLKIENGTPVITQAEIIQVPRPPNVYLY